MIDMDDVREILEETLENPYWAEYYNDAPNDKCREFIALEFYYSEFEDDKVAEEMDRIEEKLDVLRKALATGHNSAVREALMKVVPTYHTPEEVNEKAGKAENEAVR